MEGAIREGGLYRFGPYELDPVRRSVTRGEERLKLPARLFDLLLYLVRNHDRLVERDELLASIWQGRTVVEGNLGQAISNLRKALQSEAGKETYIVTVAGRGYRFAAPVTFEPLPLQGQALLSGLPTGSVPAPRTRLLRPRMFALALGAPALVGLGWALTTRHEVPTKLFSPPPHSLAVLAFDNLSGDPGQEYFSDGLSEELIGSLSRIGAVHVAARRSAFSFKGRNIPIGDIARQLNVSVVLDGSVRRVGQRVRITAALIDAMSGFQLWSQTYDLDQGDVLKIQGDLAHAVIAALRVTFLGDEARRLVAGGTANPLAFDAYLRGLKLNRSEGEAGNKAALAAFDEAIALDPNYALARCGRVSALGRLLDDIEQPDAAWVRRTAEEMKAEARRAVALAPELGAAHASLGLALEQNEIDIAGAQTELARARELAPGDPRIGMVDAEMQAFLGHWAIAVAEAYDAAALDPLTPQTYQHLSIILSYARRQGDAIAVLRQADQLAPGVPSDTADIRGYAQIYNSEPAAARVTCSGAANWRQQLCLAIALGQLGDRAHAVALLAKVRGSLGDAGAMNYAEVYALWGDRDEALRWLKTGYALHDPALIQLKANPGLDAIRDAPEYRAIVAQLDFPP